MDIKKQKRISQEILFFCSEFYFLLFFDKHPILQLAATELIKRVMMPARGTTSHGGSRHTTMLSQTSTNQKTRQRKIRHK